MNKRIYAVLAIFVMISAIALVSGPHILGATTMSGTNIELSSMTLSQIADKNSTLVVDVTVKHKVGLSGNYTFELLVDDNIVVNETKTFGSFDEKKIISLKWPVQVGTHILLVRAEGSELETLVRVTKSYGKFEIVELRDGEDTFQTHALDFKAGAEYDILVEQNDIIRAEFESQTYIFTILNIGESSVQLDFSSLSINLNILEDRAVDLNGDGTVDVNILLNKIDSDGASITIK